MINLVPTLILVGSEMLLSVWRLVGVTPNFLAMLYRVSPIWTIYTCPGAGVDGEVNDWPLIGVLAGVVVKTGCAVGVGVDVGRPRLSWKMPSSLRSTP